jgi:hypothetical protein
MALAAGVLRAGDSQAAQGPSQLAQATGTVESGWRNLVAHPAYRFCEENIRLTRPPIAATYVGGSCPQSSPNSLEIKVSPTGESPPICQPSSRPGTSSSTVTGAVTPPPIPGELGDRKQFAKAAATTNSALAPPTGGFPQFSAISSRGPLPKSQSSRQKLPSHRRSFHCTYAGCTAWPFQTQVSSLLCILINTFQPFIQQLMKT